LTNDASSQQGSSRVEAPAAWKTPEPPSLRLLNHDELQIFRSQLAINEAIIGTVSNRYIQNHDLNQIQMGRCQDIFNSLKPKITGDKLCVGAAKHPLHWLLLARLQQRMRHIKMSLVPYGLL